MSKSEGGRSVECRVENSILSASSNVSQLSALRWGSSRGGRAALPREGDLGHEAALAVDVVLDGHGAAVGQQHVVLALDAARLVAHLVLAVVVLGLGVLNLPLELVLRVKRDREGPASAR